MHLNWRARLSAWANRHPRLAMTLVTVVLSAGVWWMATSAVDDLPGSAQGTFRDYLWKVWLGGLAAGATIDLILAARDELVPKGPGVMLRNVADGPLARWATVLVPVAGVLLVTILSPVRAGHGVMLIPGVVALSGVLLPLMAVVLYVAYRIRPDELGSDDPAKRQAALARIRGTMEPMSTIEARDAALLEEMTRLARRGATEGDRADDLEPPRHS